MKPSQIWSSDSPPALLASRDVAGRLRFPPVSTDSPLQPGQETVSLPAQGWVYSFSEIHPGAKSGLAAFAVGYVDFAGPLRVFGRLVGPVAIGAACEAVPDDAFGYVFRIQPN